MIYSCSHLFPGYLLFIFAKFSGTVIMDIESRIWQKIQVDVIAAIEFLHIICIINEVILIK